MVRARSISSTSATFTEVYFGNFDRGDRKRFVEWKFLPCQALVYLPVYRTRVPTLKFPAGVKAKMPPLVLRWKRVREASYRYHEPKCATAGTFRGDCQPSCLVHLHAVYTGFFGGAGRTHAHFICSAWWDLRAEYEMCPPAMRMDTMTQTTGKGTFCACWMPPQLRVYFPRLQTSL